MDYQNTLVSKLGCFDMNRYKKGIQVGIVSESSKIVLINNVTCSSIWTLNKHFKVEAFYGNGVNP